MKTSNILLTLLAAAIGFGLAWWWKPTGSNVASTGAVTEAAATIWTCSMHPQIRSNEPGDCPICGMELIPLSSDLPATREKNLVMTPEAVALAGIQTVVVGRTTKEGSSGERILNGRIRPDERAAASLTAHLPGRIEKLYVGFTGEYVRRGQAIASIYSPELITAQRELLEAQRMQNISPSLLEAAKNKLRYWKLPEETIDAILEDGSIRENFDIYADASGVVSRKRVQVGDHVMEGGVLFDVQSLSRLWVVFDAYESDLPFIGIGDRIAFTTPAIPGRSFDVKVDFIDPVIDPSTRVARIRGTVNNASGDLKPEMFVEGRLTDQAGKADAGGQELTVPVSSVLWTGRRSVVYVHDPSFEAPTFAFREITLGERVGDQYRVEEGLSAGEEVVTQGAFMIDATAQLNNRRSMMNRKVAVKGAAPDAVTSIADQVPPSFQAELQHFVDQYLALKDALVLSDLQQSQAAAAALRSGFGEIDPAPLKAPGRSTWNEMADPMREHLRLLSDAGDLEVQRSQFHLISDRLVLMVKTFGLDEGRLYVQHCPMANNDQGADWLSRDLVIRNPYFGDRMLKCGYVIDSLESNRN